MANRAWLEHLSSLLRVGGDQAVHYDPYHFSVTIRWLNPEAVELCGADKAITTDDWRAMLQCLLEHNIKLVMVIRVREDQTKEMKWFDTDTRRRTEVLDELTKFMCGGAYVDLD